MTIGRVDALLEEVFEVLVEAVDEVIEDRSLDGDIVDGFRVGTGS